MCVRVSMAGHDIEMINEKGTKRVLAYLPLWKIMSEPAISMAVDIMTTHAVSFQPPTVVQKTLAHTHTYTQSIVNHQRPAMAIKYFHRHRRHRRRCCRCRRRRRRRRLRRHRSN